MIRADKRKKALTAIHRIILLARFMAYESKPAAEIAKVLDCAEILPTLIAADDDRTDEFCKHLQGFADTFPSGVGILQEFDRGQ